MPFCRECGKVVEAEWVTCPFCSQAIGPPATQVNTHINDSVVSSDVVTTNIHNDSGEISKAVKTVHECRECESIGTKQLACSKWKLIAFCSICEDDVSRSRILSATTMVRS